MNGRVGERIGDVMNGGDSQGCAVSGLVLGKVSIVESREGVNWR